MVTDEDGTPLRRTIDGDLVPDLEPCTDANVWCPDHPQHPARTCSACWGDVLAGERPRRRVGKSWPLRGLDA